MKGKQMWCFIGGFVAAVLAAVAAVAGYVGLARFSLPRRPARSDTVQGCEGTSAPPDA